MGAYSDEKQQYHKSRIRDIMILKPSVSAEGIQHELERSPLDPIRLDRHYIAKLTKKIKKERMLKIDRADIKERIVSMRETYEIVAQQMWNILLDEKLNYEKGGIGARVAAGKVIIEAQKNLLESEMNAGIYNRKLGTVALEATGRVDHIHRLEPEIKAPIMKALENYGIIKRVKYTIADPTADTVNPTAEPVGTGIVGGV